MFSFDLFPIDNCALQLTVANIERKNEYNGHFRGEKNF